jgi:hypothetical protein
MLSLRACTIHGGIVAVRRTQLVAEFVANGYGYNSWGPAGPIASCGGDSERERSPEQAGYPTVLGVPRSRAWLVGPEFVVLDLLCRVVASRHN